MSNSFGMEPSGDFRDMSLSEAEKPEVYQRTWGLQARVDSSVTFEEYIYWAKIERGLEHEENRQYVEMQGPRTVASVIKGRFSKGVHHDEKKRQRQLAASTNNSSVDSSIGKDMSEIVVSPSTDGAVSEEEWRTASRALRTASWGTMFYLITTDILGWSTTPFVFASVGFGPGVALYIVFGICAAFSGWILWQVYLALDSSRYPLLSYGDTFFRVYGAKSRHFINIAQSLQQFLTVAVLVLACGTTISQLANDSICFIACMIIFMVVGMLLGLIRSLQRLGWLANASVWLNTVCFLIIMIAVSHYGIDYPAVTASTLIKTIEPIKTFVGPPPDAYQQQASGFAGQFNGINALVYSYGGALLFIAFLAEMRHPWDFWKGMLCAQTFICVVYIFFGCFVYSHFGQYSIGNISNAIQPLRLQQVNNIIGLLTSAIACLLYFNIGMKTIYIEVCQQVFHWPEITSKKGKLLWFALGPIYWIVAFMVAAAVPNINGISGLVGALLILNFTYTFPAILYIGYRCQVDAALPGEGFDPHTGQTVRLDSGMKRWIRGFMVNWHVNIINTIYFMGGLVCSGMGTWAAVEGLKAVFAPGGTVATSFGCASPV